MCEPFLLMSIGDGNALPDHPSVTRAGHEPTFKRQAIRAQELPPARLGELDRYRTDRAGRC